MATEKEKYEGIWVESGETVRFNRESRGVRLTDDECDTLLNGGTITKEFVSKAGKPYTMEGRLAHQEFQNNEGETIKFIGVKYDFPKTCPKEWGGHTFTEDEKILLEQGKTIHVDGLISKKSGKEYSADLSFEEQDDGTMKIVPHFG